jgi:hypothetical protein
MKYTVWFKKYWDDSQSEFQRYVKVITIEAKHLEDVFQRMQAESWSPNGEAKDRIMELGLHHTSMSVGDFIENEHGDFYRVEGCGFERYTKLPDGEPIRGHVFSS